MVWSKEDKKDVPSRLRSAVIGVGYLGCFHAQKYAGSGGSELVAVVDVEQSRAKECARRCRTQALSDYRDLPELGVQCASVVTPTSTHSEIASWLLRNGIDVLIEKPITSTSAQASTLIELAREHKRILQVGHLERFNPAFKAVKNVLTSPMFFEVRRIIPFSGRGYDVDVILDLMIHDIDIVSHLVGRPARHIEAIGVPVITNSIDIANARITFEGGAIANVTASRTAFKSERTIRMFQPEVYISLNYGTKSLKIYSRSAKKSKLGFPEISVVEHKLKEGDALQEEINAFLSSVVRRTRPEVTGEDGLRALHLADLIRNSLEKSMVRILSDQQCDSEVADVVKRAYQGISQ